jgi:hypothetical protein
MKIIGGGPLRMVRGSSEEGQTLLGGGLDPSPGRVGESSEEGYTLLREGFEGLQGRVRYPSGEGLRAF